MMAFGRFLLLTALLAPVPVLAETQMAGDTPAKPAKSAQDCADELLRSKEAIEASGESPQEFFHRCWWDSVPGRPTPIKTPRATWDPGHGRITRKTPSPSDAKKAAEAKGVAPTRATQPVASQQTKEGKPTVGPKTSSGSTKSAERVEATKPNKLTKAVGAPTPPAKPKSIVETAPTSPATKDTATKDTVQKETASSKAASGAAPITSKETKGAKSSHEAKQAAKPAHEPAVAAPGAKGSTLVTAPDAAPASLKPAAPGAVVVKSSSKPNAPKPERLAAQRPRPKARSARIVAPRPSVATREHERYVERERYVEVEPFVARPTHHARHIARHRAPDVVAARFGPTRSAGAPLVCLYATPDASGRSRCVPLQ